MGDAFGRMFHDYYRDCLAGQPIHRREDGVSWDATEVLDWYFASPEGWPDAEFEALSHLDGRVLDVGCGAGRHALYLQEHDDGADRDGRKDHVEVIALDRSPLAVRVVRERGVEKAVVGDMEQLPFRGKFDRVLVAGGQLGGPGSIDGLHELLGELARVTVPGGRLVADVLDPTGVEDPDRRAYLDAHEIREGVSVRRFRVEYGDHAGPWIDLLLLAPAALREVVTATEWAVVEVLDRGGSYTAVLER